MLYPPEEPAESGGFPKSVPRLVGPELLLSSAPDRSVFRKEPNDVAEKRVPLVSEPPNEADPPARRDAGVATPPPDASDDPPLTDPLPVPEYNCPCAMSVAIEEAIREICDGLCIALVEVDPLVKSPDDPARTDKLPPLRFDCCPSKSVGVARVKREIPGPLLYILSVVKEGTGVARTTDDRLSSLRAVAQIPSITTRARLAATKQTVWGRENTEMDEANER